MRRRLPQRFRAAALALLVAGCTPTEPGTAFSTPSPTRNPSAAPTAEPAGTATPLTRAGDLEYLLARLEGLHPEPFVGSSETEFRDSVEALADEADALSDTEFMTSTMRLLAGRPRDGHTGVVAFEQADGVVDAWPLALYEFEEGTYVAAALEPHDDLVGARLTAVGGRPLDEVLPLVAELVPGDNEWSVRARVPGYLVVPQVLEGLRLLRPGEPALTLELPAGETRSLTPTTIPMSEFREWRGLFDPLVPPSLPPRDDGPLHLRNRDQRFWSERVEGAIYVGYNQVQASIPSTGELIATFAARVADEARRGDLDIVVDMRHNPGGENGSYPPLRDMLFEIAASRPGSVTVIAGRSTFSAASQLLSELRAGAGDAIRVVGEPTGGAPNMFGDGRRIELPASGLTVSIATRSWTPNPADTGLTIEPDLAVPVRWADFAAGRDPALDAALAAARG